MRTDHPIDASPLVSPSAPNQPPLGSSPHALHRRTRLENRMLSPGGRAWSIAATHTEPSPTASRSAAGQRSTAIRSEARRPHHGQSLSSRAALHSHPLRSPSPALQPVAHAAGRPLYSHPLSSRPLNLMFFHAHRGPPSSPRATSSTTTSIGGRVAPTSCSHTRTPHSFALPRVTSTGGCRTGWFHPGSTTRNVRYPRSDGGYVWDYRACFSCQIWLGLIGTSVRPALRAFSLGPIERTHTSRPQWV